MRIDLAYCIELKKNVDIYHACLEFSKQDEHEKFHFLCSDPSCRNSKPHGVRITAVNHQYLPEDEDVFKSPHYRKWDDHISDCEWSIINTILAEPTQAETENAYQYKLSKKVKRLITRFIVPDGNENSDTQESELQTIRTEKNPEVKKNRLRKYIKEAGSTATSMEALVSCYEELKLLNSLDEVITIVGHGKTSFREFFQQIRFAPKNTFAIMHGGARLYKRYGAGFSLNFIDRYGDKPVNLYVSTDQIRNSAFGPRLARMVDELERQKGRNPYLRVYWLGGFTDKEKHYNVHLDSLSHVVFRIAYPMNKESQS